MIGWLKNLILLIILLIPSVSVLTTNLSKIQAIVKEKPSIDGDQDAIYKSFNSAFTETEVPRGIKNGWMAVGYLSLIGFYHKTSIFRTTPDIYSSFMYHGLLYAVLAAFLSVLLMYRVACDESPRSNKFIIAICSVLLWLSLFKLTNIF